MKAMSYEFVALGDITTDSFIRLSKEYASVECNEEGRPCKICMNFGDKLPYDFVEVIRAVGNSPNAAVSAHRLGLNSAISTNIGDDDNGKKCLDQLKREGVSTDLVVTHKGKKTNHHYVLWYENERTILIKHEEYEYKMPDIGSDGWLYLSSLGENSLPFHGVIADYLDSNPKIKLAFQPGTFQIKQGHKKLKRIYENTEVFFCNVEEAMRILQTDKRDIPFLLEEMHKLGPTIAVITDGPKGAYAYKDGEAWFMPPYPDPKEPYDRTGAGDSFSSTFVSALALGKEVPEALTWAPINSMSVVQKVGAQAGLLHQDELLQFLKDAPADYKVKKL